MKEAIDKLQQLTREITRNGNPFTISEQLKFRTSFQKVAIYWSEHSFVCFFKSPMGNTFFQVVFCTVENQNGEIKIHARPTLNRISYILSIFASAITALSVVLGLVFKQEVFIAFPLMYPFAAAVCFLINRHNRKEARWFIDDLLAEIQSK